MFLDHYGPEGRGQRLYPLAAWSGPAHFRCRPTYDRLNTPPTFRRLAMRPRSLFTPAVLLSICLFILPGCWWNEKPKELQAAAQATQAALDAAQGEAARWRAEVERLEAAPGLTEKEAELLADLKSMLAGADAWVSKIQSAASEAQAMLANAGTNGDVVLSTIGVVGGALGIPLVGLVTDTLKQRGRMKRLIGNIESARVEGPEPPGVIALNHDTFKAANIAAGLQPIIYAALGKKQS